MHTPFYGLRMYITLVYERYTFVYDAVYERFALVSLMFDPLVYQLLALV